MQSGQHAVVAITVIPNPGDPGNSGNQGCGLGLVVPGVLDTLDYLGGREGERERNEDLFDQNAPRDRGVMSCSQGCSCALSDY